MTNRFYRKPKPETMKKNRDEYKNLYPNELSWLNDITNFKKLRTHKNKFLFFAQIYMHIDKIKINNFKNYNSAEISFSSKINFLYGKNGAGKTNLLDAIYYLSYGKSMINSFDLENINHNKSFFPYNNKLLIFFQNNLFFLLLCFHELHEHQIKLHLHDLYLNPHHI